MSVHTLEDSTSGLCHTPGTRAGFTTLVGSNPTSSASTNRCSLLRTPVVFVFWGLGALRLLGFLRTLSTHVFRLLELTNAKTAGQDLSEIFARLVFRVLEFEEADTGGQVRTDLTPQHPHPTYTLEMTNFSVVDEQLRRCRR